MVIILSGSTESAKIGGAVRLKMVRIGCKRGMGQSVSEMSDVLVPYSSAGRRSCESSEAHLLEATTSGR